MWKSALAGAVALAIIGTFSATRDGVAIAQAAAQEAVAPAGVIVTDATISRIKRALRLSPAQEVHWRAVEATLRGIMRSSHVDESDGLIQRVRAKIGSYVVSAAAAQQVAAAARPLIASLDEQQKQDGLDAIRTFGVAALF
jgi:hypothetical protein